MNDLFSPFNEQDAVGLLIIVKTQLKKLLNSNPVNIDVIKNLPVRLIGVDNVECGAADLGRVYTK